MPSLWSRVLWMLLWALSAPKLCHADDVRAGAAESIVESFQRWTNAAGGCEQIVDYNSPWATRGTVEAVLACKALRLANYPGRLVLVSMPNYSRALLEARLGHVDMPAETIWDVELNAADFLSTAAVIERGEFKKGIYVKRGKEKVVVKTLRDLRGWTPVMPRNWRVDWATLQDMGFEPISVPTKESIFRTLDHDGADFTLLEFSAHKDLLQLHRDVELAPVPGVAVVLAGERRFAVSRAAPQAAAIAKALDEGLGRLRRSGEIRRAWSESGFWNATASGWTVLNAAP